MSFRQIEQSPDRSIRHFLPIEYSRTIIDNYNDDVINVFDSILRKPRIDAFLFFRGFLLSSHKDQQEFFAKQGLISVESRIKFKGLVDYVDISF